ncbi:MAG: carbohydrate ABC transporter substrate-binding protein [Pseudomonadota bacterium]
MTARGLTWDHPRGRDALEEIARRANSGRKTPLIEWVAQSLEGFESAPIAEIAAERDLLVLDHPHIGEAVAEDCLIPLDDLYPRETLERWESQSVGASMSSYVWAGKRWALPLDVASQVMARRPDIIDRPPVCWLEVEDIAKRHPVALSLAGPHALLTLFSLCAAEGHLPQGEGFLPDGSALSALWRMQEFSTLAPSGSEALNPIQMLEAMGRGEIALCPLIFGYVTYSEVGTGQVAFSNPIGPRAGGVLGGTGLAFTRRARPTLELLSHVATLMDADAQSDLIPAFGGQPSARGAWTSIEINARWGGFYANTLKSVERAFLRPRFDGYVAFQSVASARLRRAIEAGEKPQRTLEALRGLWREVRAKARGALDDERHIR